MQRRSNRAEPLLQVTNEELKNLERANRANRARRRLEVMDDDLVNNPQGGNDQADAAAQAALIQQMQEELRQLRAYRQQHQQQAPPPPAPVPARTIGDTDTPHQFYQNRAAICPPEIPRNDYEIKPQMIALVKQHAFHGLPAENPMDHIENFEEICGTSKSNGVLADYVKCKLFPFSLADKAHRWLKSLPPSSFTSWTECRAGFLDHFYTKSKTAALRNKIITFQQLMGESFCEAWERFKEYRRECPHHGYSDEQMLSTFYDGVDWEYKHSLNAASNGNFMTQSITGAYQLIENLAASSNMRSSEYDRSKKVSSVESQRIDELNAKVSQLMKANQRGVQFVEDGSEVIQFQDAEQGDSQDFQEVSYIGRQGFRQNKGFNQNYRNHPNFSYRNTNVENPQDQVYPQQKPVVQGSGFQKNYSQGFQQQQYQQNPVVQNSSYQKPFSGEYQQKQPFNNYQAPSTPPPGPQDELKGLMQQLLVQQQKTSSDMNMKVDNMYSELSGRIDAINSHLKVLDTQVAQPAEAMKRQKGILPARSEQNPKNTQGVGPSHAQVNFIEDEAPPQEKRLESMMKKILEGQTRSASLVNERLDALDWQMANLSCEFQQEIKGRMQSLSSSEPSVPSRSDKSNQTANAKKKQPRPTPPQIGISSSTRQVPVSVAQISLKTVGIVGSSSCKLLPKLEDPGKFVVPCSVLGTEFEDSICDSGSTVNIMSLDIVRSLKLVDSMEPSKMTLRFADATVKTSKGCIKDLLVRVGDCMMHVDFQVVEMNQGSYMPLILGRPFLATAGAVVDLPNKRVCLSKVNKAVFYDAVSVCNWSSSGSYVTIKNCKLKDTFTPEPGGEMSSSKLILTPKKIVDDGIEYKLKSSGLSRPFSRVRALITPELKAKGHDAVNDMMSKVLMLDLDPAPPHPDPPTDHTTNA